MLLEIAMPEISVIVPVYNTGKYLSECLDSLLAQTFTDFEIICINDGSTDNSADILSEYSKRDNRIKIIEQKNSGVVVARNNGVAHAVGQYLYPLDSDDKIHPTTLEKLYSAMLARRGDIITCRVMQFGYEHSELALPKPNKINLCTDNCLVNAALFRRSDFIACGGYSNDCKVALEDYDLWLNLVFKCNLKIYRVPEILFYYRIKDKSESRNFQNRDAHPGIVKRMYEKYPGIKMWRKIRKAFSWAKKSRRFVFRIQDNRIKIFKIPVWKLRRYDTVISVGAACFVPAALKSLELRDFSGPFDWMFGSDVITRLNIIYNEFENYFNIDDFEYVAENPDNGKSTYRNNRTGIVYNHDFEPGDFTESFPPVAEKYERRISRMMSYLKSNKKVLLVFAELGQTGNRDQIINIVEKINNKFSANIDFLYINHNPNIVLGRYSRPKRISPHVIYSEYYYKTFPTETPVAQKITKCLVKKVAK
jgi:glycosyltransferase involved in cell wall biosynthesis